MKSLVLIPNIFLAATAAFFVFVGTSVYIWNKVPDAPAENRPVILPDKPTVLSESTRQVELYLPPGPQPQIGVPTSLIPTEVLEVKGAVSVIINSLITSSAGHLVSLLSSDLASLYSATQVQSALSQAVTSTGNIIDYKTLGEPNVTGSYADQNVEVTTTGGVYRFQVFLKREAGNWKLMGTEPLP